jgi:hypothetical protein
MVKLSIPEITSKDYTYQGFLLISIFFSVFMSKKIVVDMEKRFGDYFDHPLVKILAIFSLLFVYSKNMYLSLIGSISIFTLYILLEKEEDTCKRLDLEIKNL